MAHHPGQRSGVCCEQKASREYSSASQRVAAASSQPPGTPRSHLRINPDRLYSINARSHFLLDDPAKIHQIIKVLIVVMACAVLPALWLRDYMALRMSPRRRAMRRALVYGSAMLVSSAIIWEFASGMGLGRFVGLVQSPAILFLLIAVQIAAGAACIWIKQTQSYDWMWATALLPAPIMWLLILETARGLENTSGPEAAQGGFFGIGILWAAFMIVAIFRTRDAQMSVEDMDFAVIFGGLSHWLAACAVSVALALA